MFGQVEDKYFRVDNDLCIKGDLTEITTKDTNIQLPYRSCDFSICLQYSEGIARTLVVRMFTYKSGYIPLAFIQLPTMTDEQHNEFIRFYASAMQSTFADVEINDSKAEVYKVSDCVQFLRYADKNLVRVSG